MRLAHLAHLLPVRMIAILQPACGVAADRLQVQRLVAGIAHLDIGRRHRERIEALDDIRAADRLAALRDEAEALAAPDATDGQFILMAEPQAKLARETRHASRRRPVRSRRNAAQTASEISKFC